MLVYCVAWVTASPFWCRPAAPLELHSSNRKSHWIFKKPRFPLRVRHELHLTILPGWRKWHTDHIWGWSGSHSIKSQPGVNNICTAQLKIKHSQRAERSPQHTRCLRRAAETLKTTSSSAKKNMFTCGDQSESRMIIHTRCRPDDRLHLDNRSIWMFSCSAVTLNTWRKDLLLNKT